MSRIDRLPIHPDAFTRMHNLRFIKFYYPEYFLGEHKGSLLLQHGLNSLHGELRYFHWEGSPLKYLPSNFSPENLVELILPESDVKNLWDGDRNLVNLKVMDLRRCKNLTKLPILIRCENLEVLLVRGCKSLVDLPCMTHLKFLQSELDFNGCHNIKKFPEVPKHIKRLVLSWTAIKEVPSSIECLEKLAFLDLRGTRIGNLPSSILKLDALEVIDLSCCSNITSFPHVPENTRNLYLADTAIKAVHSSSIARLPSLVQLSLRNCKMLKCLSPDILLAPSLLALDLNGCSNLTIEPRIFDRLRKQLKNLDASEVNIVYGFPAIHSSFVFIYCVLLSLFCHYLLFWFVKSYRPVKPFWGVAWDILVLSVDLSIFVLIDERMWKSTDLNLPIKLFYKEANA
ncbi:hypothetical protein V6N12_027883 [Hibiscus sabdariffa]|uniref:Disease resistance protein RPS4B/Roq1-like leucine-rich repeats domain-containing protein n=1 Tax=Hibiscus sabdariffa TaxID=183260 RepID=A0ABR2F472_9ROSI